MIHRLSFNLVIENLIFSRQHVGSFRISDIAFSFNLVIENLIFSSPGPGCQFGCPVEFQSRNRESYLFK